MVGEAVENFSEALDGMLETAVGFAHLVAHPGQ